MSSGTKLMSESMNSRSVQSVSRKSCTSRLRARDTTEHPQMLPIWMLMPCCGADCAKRAREMASFKETLKS